MLKEFKKTFLTGVLILLPLGLTAYIFYAGFLFFDNILQQLIHQILYIGLGIEFFRNHTIPGIGLITLIGLTILTGILARNIFVGKILQWWYRKIEQIPVIGNVYKPLAQISEAIFSGKGDSFKKPVVIEFPRKGMYSIAFITCEAENPVGTASEQDLVTVFMPTSPNPTSGFLVSVLRSEITELNMTAEDALKMILSGGAIAPQKNLSQNES